MSQHHKEPNEIEFDSYQINKKSFFFHTDPKKAGKKVVEADKKVEQIGKNISKDDPLDIKNVDKAKAEKRKQRLQVDSRKSKHDHDHDDGKEVPVEAHAEHEFIYLSFLSKGGCSISLKL